MGSTEMISVLAFVLFCFLKVPCCKSKCYLSCLSKALFSVIISILFFLGGLGGT